MPRWLEIFGPWIAIATILAVILRKPWPMFVVAGVIGGMFAIIIIAALVAGSFGNLRDRYRKRRDPAGFERALLEKEFNYAVDSAAVQLRLLITKESEGRAEVAVRRVLSMSEDPKYRNPTFWRRLAESRGTIADDTKLQRVLGKALVEERH